MKENLSPQDSARRAFHPSWLACAVLGILILVVFGASRHYALLNYDEHFFIIEDTALHVFEWERIPHIFQTYFEMAYNPLVRISYMVDYALWGTDPGGYRSTNFLLHWVAAWCVFGFVYTLTRRQVTAWTVALGFAVHPSRVESVVWLGERKDVLAATFGFAALWLYQKSKGERARMCPGESSGLNPPALTSHFSLLTYLACVLMYTCALASKPQWVPLCVMFIVTDLYDRSPLTKRVLMRYAVFFVLSAVFAWLAMDSQRSYGNTLLKHDTSRWLLIVNPMIDVAWYVGHVLWPVNLLPNYPREIPNLMQITVSCLVILAGSVGMLVSWRGKREFFWGVSWFFLFLAPMLNLFPRGLITADRYLYIAIVGTLFPVGMFLSRQKVTVASVVLGVLGVAMIGLTWRYMPVWKDDVTLWSYAVERSPKNSAALAYLLRAQVERGDYRAAQPTYQQALAIRERFAILYESASLLAQKTGQDPREPFQIGLQTARDKAGIKLLYGQYWLREKNYAEAEKYLRESFEERIGIRPAFDLAQVYEATGQYEKGIGFVVLFLNSQPYHPEAWSELGKLKEKLGQMKQQQGNTQEAERCFEAARVAYELSAQFQKSLAEPRLGLARLAIRHQKWSEAERWLQEMHAGCVVGGRMPAEGYDLLATVYHQQGKWLPALTALTEAVQIEDQAGYWLNLARLQTEMGRSPRKALEHVLSREPQRRTELAADPVLGKFIKELS